ncbi:MAG TPA: hypothetical protein VEX36_12780 [Thermoleophilaceae bacterium]|nr:hypothetical protein [Thermoleophilaceae bacterium]
MARATKGEAPAANGRAEPADLEAIEREHVEQLARAHAALAAAQDRSYWLDRWGVDLNALMRRPGASRLRALLRWLRELRRGQIAVQRYVQTRLADLRETAAEDELAANDDPRS